MPKSQWFKGPDRGTHEVDRITTNININKTLIRLRHDS